jgi:DNA-binding response OmpR family regulator
MLSLVAKKKVLLAEDDYAISKALIDALERSNYEVHRVGAGTDVIKEIQLVQPDIVLLDILLPGISGRTLLQTLRGQEMNFQKPIVVLTNLPDDESLRQELDTRNVIYLKKSSTSLTEVLSIVAQALSK